MKPLAYMNEPPSACYRPQCRPICPVRRANSATRRATFTSCSCWHWASSIWCWRRSFRELFVDPFIIMLTVPLSMTGALLALQLTGNTLNIYSQIGLITLVGLITKHGILLVRIRQSVARSGAGASREAVVETCELRLQPI